jgi:hypothetical protein
VHDEMKRLRDPIVGELAHDHFWQRTDVVTLFGAHHRVILRFEGESDDALDASQQHAFRGFELRRAILLRDAEAAILQHYHEVSPEYRKMFGSSAAERLPIVSNASDLASLVTPTHIWFPSAYGAGERVVGILCDCSWDPGHGLAVKVVNEVIAEVGPQDIVL